MRLEIGGFIIGTRRQYGVTKTVRNKVCNVSSFLFSLLFLTDDSGDEFPADPPVSGQGGSCRNSEIQSTLRTLSNKVEDLSTCNDLIVKHGSALQRYWLFEEYYPRETKMLLGRIYFLILYLFVELLCFANTGRCQNWKGCVLASGTWGIRSDKSQREPRFFELPLTP